jgi:Brp/Blh family beta-carotene 15,15'-monooxygenase
LAGTIEVHHFDAPPRAGLFCFSGARCVPWVVLTTAAALSLFSPDVTAYIAAWPFVVALVLMGMPHGAADWAVAARLRHRSGFIQQSLGFVPYLLMMLACLAALLLAPGISALAFLAMTVFHFGMADSTALRADHDGAAARWTLVTSRGLLLLATAFAAHPEAAWEPFGRIATAMSPWHLTTWQPNLTALQGWATLGSASGAVLALTSAALRTSRGHFREAICDLSESALVVIIAMYGDPLFAVGIYFIGVHAFRHCRRLARTRSVIEPPPQPAPFLQRMLRVHALSLPLMVATAACLIPLCIVLGGFDLRSIAVASIAFYMISTLPHHLLGLELPADDPGDGREAACVVNERAAVASAAT